MEKRYLLGYQIIDKENNTPEEFTSFEILTMELADYWIRYFNKRKDWVLLPIYMGDIEKPRIIDLEDPPEAMKESEIQNRMVDSLSSGL